MMKDWDEETWALFNEEHENEWRQNEIDDKYADYDVIEDEEE